MKARGGGKRGDILSIGKGSNGIRFGIDLNSVIDEVMGLRNSVTMLILNLSFKHVRLHITPYDSFLRLLKQGLIGIIDMLTSLILQKSLTPSSLTTSFIDISQHSFDSPL
jgi:hypothetical protein